jgi:modulator of FtsH protease
MILASGFIKRQSGALGMGLLFAVGLVLGLAVGPTLNYYVAANGAQVLWQAAGATALFIAGFGAWGYATRRDLAPYVRVFFWALIGLIVFGIVMIFVQIPGGQMIWAILGLVIFAFWTAFDFQRLKRSTTGNVAVPIALGIFLDIFNVFLFFLQIFGGGGSSR